MDLHLVSKTILLVPSKLPQHIKATKQYSTIQKTELAIVEMALK